VAPDPVINYTLFGRTVIETKYIVGISNTVEIINWY